MIEDSYYISSQTKISIRDVLFDIGLQYSWRLSPVSKLVVGTTFNFPTKLNADKNFISYKANSSSNVQESIDEEELNKGYINYPLKVTAGFSYDYKDRWLLAGDYTFQNMSKYREFRKEQGYNDYHKAAIGLSYLPARLGRYWWQRNRYNVGFYGVRTHLEPDNKSTPINVFGATVGTQMSINIANRELLLGVGFDFGIRGTEKEGLIREQYAKIRLNVAFKEGWFAKRKIY